MSSFQIDFTNATTVFNSLKGYCKNTTKNFAIMKIAFADENVALLYEKAIEKHNKSFLENVYCDSGFDLYVPEDVAFTQEFESKFIDMKVKVEMIQCDVTNDDSNKYPTGFHLYARSSISKTPLMLANHVGIIDSGYRGSIIGAFRWLHMREDPLAFERYVVEKGTRLLQICHPTLCPVYVMVVPESQLSSTERGAGGFGSTGV